MAPAEASPVLKSGCLLGEGAFWDESERQLIFVDIKGHAVFRWRPGTEPQRLDLPGQVGFAVPASDGGLIAGMGMELCRMSWEGAVLETLCKAPSDDPGPRINDGTIGPDGTIWFGTMDDAEVRPLGHYWSYDTRTGLKRHPVGWSVTNGPAVSPDGRRIYLAHSDARVVHTADIQNGTLVRMREFVRFPESWGHPDGVAVDEAEHVWIAHWDGARVTRFDPAGRPVSAIVLPTARPTKCAFGGPDRRTLYITTASIGSDTDADPLAGHVFSCAVEIPGPALPRFTSPVGAASDAT